MLRVCSLLVLLATPALAGPLTGTARIIDGDTLGLATPGGEAIIRLHGIDAPERGQSCADAAGDAYPCGVQATEALGALVGRARVTCEPLDMDRHERIVARCAARGRDLGQAMVAAGMARAYLRYATDYLPDENAARAARRGQWAGEAEEPALYRLARTTHAAPPAEGPGDCTIKGNISTGGRIYHLPGGRWYDRTAIDPAVGERWFCSPAEAEAAGWRAARG